MLAPYHMGNAYVRAAISECWATAWIPLLFYFLHCSATSGGRKAWFGVAGSYAMLVLSHLPVTLMISPVLLTYAIWFSQPGQRVKAAGRTMFAVAAALGVTAIYWIPCMGLHEHVRINHISEWTLSWDNSFVLGEFRPGAPSGPYFGLRRYSVLLLVFGAVVFVSYLLIRRSRDNREQRRFWLGTMAYGVVMATPLSVWAWGNLPLLPLVLFPYRFFVIVSIATVVLVALAIVAYAKMPVTPMRRVLAAGLACMILMWSYATVDRIRARSAGRAESEANTALMMGWPEYRPAAFEGNGQSSDWMFDVPRVAVADGAASSRIQAWTARRITLTVDAAKTSRIHLGLFFHAQWKATLEGQPLSTQPTEQHALTQLTVPPGRHTLELQFEPTRQETLGQALSLISLLALAAGAAWRRRGGEDAAGAGHDLRCVDA